MLGHGQSKLNDEFGDEEHFTQPAAQERSMPTGANHTGAQSVKRINKNGTTPYKYNDRRMSRQNIPANCSFNLNTSNTNSNAAR